MSARFMSVIVAALIAIVAVPALAAPKNAKLALYYDGMTKVVKKNVRKVRNPSTGIWCIKRKFSGDAIFELGIAGTEVDTSGGPDLLAHWAYGAGNCNNSSAWFEVQTYRMSGSTWVLANDVAFTFLVP